MERSVQRLAMKDRPRLPPSNAHIIFKRTFETEFGQKSLKIGRILAACRAIIAWALHAADAAVDGLPQKRRRFSTALPPRAALATSRADFP
jgi:hypothetical protein